MKPKPSIEQMREKEDFHECVICKNEYPGYGNNPEPYARYSDGQCCDFCNATVVIPLRIKSMRANN